MRLALANNTSPVGASQEQVEWFFKRFPSGRIVTRLMERTGSVVVFRARLYRFAEDRRASATGWSLVFFATGPGAAPAREKAESAAVARALTNLGIADIAEDASHASGRATSRQALDRAPTSSSLGVHRSSGDPRREESLPGLGSVGHATSTEAAERDRRLRVQPSPFARDIQRLLAEATLLGVRPRRAAVWARNIDDGRWSPDELERFERWLRGWVQEARVAARLAGSAFQSS